MNRKKIFDIIEKSDGKSSASLAYDIFMVVMIFISIFPLMFAEEYQIFTYTEWIATIVFIIDYILRWATADLRGKRKGIMAFVLYPFTKWAIIDILSILPSIGLINESFKVMRATRLLRLLRLLKTLRYDSGTTYKGFIFFWRGFQYAKREIYVSIQVLIALTLFLAIALFVVEHVAQPEVYNNLWDSIVWSFMSYLGNPGKFSPGDPVTYLGRFIWIVISVIKIAIFAVPAGLIANGFREAVGKDKKVQKDKDDAQKIIDSIYVHSSRLYGVKFWPKKYYRINEIKMNLGLSEPEIVGAVASADDLKLFDLSLHLTNYHGSVPEMLAVEYCNRNTRYGFCSNYEYEDFPKVDSNITLVCPIAVTECCLSYFAYQIARIGRYNVVINDTLQPNADMEENRSNADNIHDFQYNAAKDYPKLHQYVDDIRDCIRDNDDWVIVLYDAPIPDEENKQQKIRINLNVSEEKENNTIDDCTNINDIEKFKAFYEDLKEVMMREHDIETVIDYRTNPDKYIQNYIRNNMHDFKPNVIEIGIADDFRVFGADVRNEFDCIKNLAEIIHRHFETANTDWDTSSWTVKEMREYRSAHIPCPKCSEDLF